MWWRCDHTLDVANAPKARVSWSFSTFGTAHDSVHVRSERLGSRAVDRRAHSRGSVPSPAPKENMRVSPSSGRARRAATIVLIAGLASTLVGTGLTSANAATARDDSRSTSAAPVYALHKANFGISPGAGFLL